MGLQREKKMPLVRLQVRNEFGLGQPELYRETNREDPKAVLDGVAVAGLVGILRQLGDLAEYVFSFLFSILNFDSFCFYSFSNTCIFSKMGWLISVVLRL